MRTHRTMSELTAEERVEDEANYFAMCLLMPEALVHRWCEGQVMDSAAIDRMARDFVVSYELAVLRLNDLGIGIRM